MSEGLKPRRARGGAFAADRTDLDDVMTTPSPPMSELMPKIAPAQGRPAGATETKGAVRGTAERARGVGGRPPRAASEPAPTATSEPTATATSEPAPTATGARLVTKRPARIPADLYAAAETLVKGPGKPSWGQLVFWACTTERDAVLERVARQLAPSDPLAPRGANRAGGVTTPIIPQFLGAEIEPVDEIQRAAQADIADVGPRPVKVTATAVVIAALRVAVEKRSA